MYVCACIFPSFVHVPGVTRCLVPGPRRFVCCPCHKVKVTDKETTIWGLVLGALKLCVDELKAMPMPLLDTIMINLLPMTRDENIASYTLAVVRTCTITSDARREGKMWCGVYLCCVHINDRAFVDVLFCLG